MRLMWTQKRQIGTYLATLATATGIGTGTDALMWKGLVTLEQGRTICNARKRVIRIIFGLFREWDSYSNPFVQCGLCDQ